MRETISVRAGRVGAAGSAVAFAAVVALATACPGTIDYDFLKNPDAPAAMQSACKVMVRKCSRCHDPERFSVYRPQSPPRVETLVERMRRLPGSNITSSQGEVITDCLVYRNFGDEGLAVFRGKSAAEGDEPSDRDGEDKSDKDDDDAEPDQDDKSDTSNGDDEDDKDDEDDEDEND